MENTSIKKKIKYNTTSTYEVVSPSGASLTVNSSNNRVLLNFFSERPVLPEYAELTIDKTNGLVLNEKNTIDEEYLDVERVMLSGVEMDFNTLKAIASLLINQVNFIENNSNKK